MSSDGKVIGHPSSWSRSDLAPAEAINVASHYEWRDVIIVGFGKDGDFICKSSHMTRELSLWITEHLKLHVMDRL